MAQAVSWANFRPAVAPATYHRVVEYWDATPRIQRMVGRLMVAALIPFALAIGINVFVAMERIASPGSAALAGLAATAEALWFWFGMLRRKHRKGKDMK